MLHLLLSPSVGGTTKYICTSIAQSVAVGADTVLIVPEQYSFAAERTVLSELGIVDGQKVEIMSFTRLANTVFNAVGWDKGKRINEAGKMLLMSRALEQCADRLEVYRRSSESPAVVREMLGLSEEFDRCAITPEAVVGAMNHMEDGLLKSKLHDISLVLSVYDSFIADGRLDDSQLLTRLKAKLSECGWFRNKTVYLDSFRGFTAQEMGVIGQMLGQAADVYVSLTAPNLDDLGSDDIFYHTKNTAKKLIKLSRSLDVAVAKPVVVKAEYHDPMLKSFSESFLSPEAEVFEDDCDSISVIAAPDVRSECAYVAAKIKRLLRMGEYKCRDIAVIFRDESTYMRPMRAALARCEVPVFEDRRQPVINQPLMTLVRAALKMADGGFDTDSMLRALKTGLCSLNAEEVSELENYTYLWQINGNGWLREWESSPDGFGEMTENAKTELERLNELRLRATEPFVKFRGKMKNNSAEGCARALYELLEDLNTAEQLRNFAENLEDSGESALALETERLWNVLCDMLDTVAEALGKVPVPAGRFAHLFDLMLNTVTLGEIPQSLEEVAIGSAQRMRPMEPKAVFVLGANAGKLPLNPAENGMLNAAERERLAEAGLETASYGEDSVAEERFIAYSACCCAMEMLSVSYPSKSMQGDELCESEIVTFIREHFPKAEQIDTLTADKLTFVEGKAPAFELTAMLTRDGGELYESLKKYFAEDSDYSHKLSALDSAAAGRSFKIDSTDTALRLFGENINISPSRAETFYRCPFSYYCRYGLKLKENKTASFDPLQRGTVIHFVLEKLLSEVSAEELCKLSSSERLEKIRSYMDDYLSRYLDRSSRSRRFIYLYERMARSIDAVAARMADEFACSEFRPLDLELEISYDGSVKPYTLELPTGGKVRVSGKVDRVDGAKIGDDMYIRVIDYKSSGKAFAVADVLSGLNMQMLIYLFTLIKNGYTRYGNAVPAGVLYMPAKASVFTAERGSLLDAQGKASDRKMQGFVLENADVIIAMEHDGNGVYIPAKIDSNGKIKGNVLDLNELSELWNRVDELLVDMGEELHRGEISALPVQGKRYKDICSSCEYWDICTREKNMPVREIDEDATVGEEVDE